MLLTHFIKMTDVDFVFLLFKIKNVLSYNTLKNCLAQFPSDMLQGSLSGLAGRCCQ